MICLKCHFHLPDGFNSEPGAHCDPVFGIITPSERDRLERERNATLPAEQLEAERRHYLETIRQMDELRAAGLRE